MSAARLVRTEKDHVSLSDGLVLAVYFEVKLSACDVYQLIVASSVFSAGLVHGSRMNTKVPDRSHRERKREVHDILVQSPEICTVDIHAHTAPLDQDLYLA